jgi:apolipoprotein N-acyltransferase
VILLWMTGGPSHIDTWDPKPGRPTQGEFQAIKTSAPGVEISEIFPELARDWTHKGANLLVNITNDAWYGRSSAPWQHLSMSVFRAVENRRSLVRSANTGVSAVIDPLGRITGDSPLFQPFYLVADVPLLQVKTIFVILGHYFGLICLIVCLPILLLLRQGKRREM